MMLQEDQVAFLRFAHLLEATGQNDETNYHLMLEKPSISFLEREVAGKIEIDCFLYFFIYSYCIMVPPED